MKCWQWVTLVTLSVIVGFTRNLDQAYAAVPAACPMFECKTIHAYWAGNNQVASAMFQVNMQTNSNDGFESIFTPTSVEKKPCVASGNYDLWSFPSCNPMCGKDNNGKWQGPQEVAEAGQGNRNQLGQNLQRQPCTSNNGNIGPTIQNPTNANTMGINPLGVTADGDPVPPGP